LSAFFQSKIFKQSKIHVYNDIRTIILDYCDGITNYKQFSYKITPYIFKNEDGEINDKKVENILVQVIALMDMYVDYEITTQQKLKDNLRSLV